MDHVNEWEEQVALQPVVVEVLGRTIARHKNKDSILDKRLKKPLQNHCVGDVQHLKLINIKESKVLAHLVPHDGDSLTCPPLEFLIHLVFALVDL